MKLLIVRHAETNYNAKKLVNYDPEVDVHLTAKGEEQAKKLAEDLREARIDLIITSRLKRTKQTAEFANKYHGVSVIEDKRLDDVRNGFEGKPVAEAGGWRDAQEDPLGAKLGEEWESVRDVNARAREFLQDVAKRSEGVILVVTSSHIIKHLKLIHESRPIADALAPSVPNAEVYEMEMSNA